MPNVNELGIMYSHTCNIECRHCGINSGPKNRDRMSLELAERIIDEAALITPAIRTIVFTGGEALVHPEDIETLVERAADLDFETRIVTNGFWGKHPEKGRRLLSRLRFAGLTSLNFSADKYHLEFQPASTLRSAITIARDMGYPITVSFTHNGPEDICDVFAELYGMDREELVRYDPDSTTMLEEFHAQSASKILVSGGRLVGMGRAAEYPEEHYLTSLNTFSYGACQEVGQRPVIYPDGTLQACCCAGGKLSTFAAGNVHREPLAEICARLPKRTHFRFINTFGPRRLYEVMAEARGLDVTAPHPSLCDLCVKATTGSAPATVDAILEDWAAAQLLSGKVKSGEAAGNPPGALRG
ncbi:MAG: MoaA/NifB/PqqE/SkfB family radical SAM enzyme [Brevundimonas sp.]|jgi:MoaA/NifB/PqqE/SkfB family radical SAM enzyme